MANDNIKVVDKKAEKAGETATAAKVEAEKALSSIEEVNRNINKRLDDMRADTNERLDNIYELTYKVLNGNK